MATRFRLRELIETKGLTQTDVQVKSGLAYSTVNEMANNRTRRVDLDTLDALCSALDCQIGDIVDYVPDRKRGRG